jgi:hypothetical protein
MRRQLFFAAACVALICAYGYTLMWVEGYCAVLPIPRQWFAFFHSRASGFLSFAVLFDAVVLILASLPFAALLARFGGRRATIIALITTTVLFAVTMLPSVIEDIGRGAYAGFRTPWRLYIAFGYLELIAALPLLVWVLRKLSSNNRRGYRYIPPKMMALDHSRDKTR